MTAHLPSLVHPAVPYDPGSSGVSCSSLKNTGPSLLLRSVIFASAVPIDHHFLSLKARMYFPSGDICIPPPPPRPPPPPPPRNCFSASLRDPVSVSTTYTSL